MTVLVIVESSKKAKTIQKFLGEGYEVWACGGHIRHMTTNGLGYDEQTYEIQYELDENKAQTINTIKDAIHNKKTVSKVILASDPDREGEAIAASLFEELDLFNVECQRSRFNEITQSAIKKAIDEASSIDYDLVAAQETRRILDRAVGWKGTSAISQSLNKLTPIGRVQSPAVSFVVKREQEINAFQPKEYFEVVAEITDGSGNIQKVKLDPKKSGLTDNNLWTNNQEAIDFEIAVKECDKKIYCVEVNEVEKHQAPPAPLTTLDMQKLAIQNLKISGKEADTLAQELYQEGIITYPRTDSTRISEEGYRAVHSFGVDSNLPMAASMVGHSLKNNAQDAHECIRPTSFNDSAALEALNNLSEKHRKLYNLIKDRTLMSQMQPKEYIKKSYYLEAKIKGKSYYFTGEHNHVTNPGFAGYGKDIADEDLLDDAQNEGSCGLDLVENSSYIVDNYQVITKQTKPPSRFTQSSLIKELDKKGIGRPSTFSSIFEKIVEHGYIEESTSDRRELRPTDFGNSMCDKIKNFAILQPTYTKEMESKLDKIVYKRTSDEQYDKKKLVEELLLELEKDIKNFQEQDIEDRMTKHSCLKSGCFGKLYLVNKKDKNGKPISLYKCKSCGHWHFIGEDGNPIDPEAKLKERYDEEGNPKHPCPECESALYRLEGKNGYFWKCDSRNNQNGRCSYTCNDKDGQPSYSKQEFREKTETLSCPCCKKDMTIRKTKNGYEFAKCYNCGYMSWVRRDAGVPFLTDNYDKYKQYILVEDPNSKFGVKPRVACECGAALKKVKTKDGSYSIICTGHLAFDTRSKCTSTLPSVEKYNSVLKYLLKPT